MVTLYHATDAANVASILATGFRLGTYFTTSLEAAWSFADRKFGVAGTVLAAEVALTSVEETVAYFPGGGGTVYQLI